MYIKQGVLPEMSKPKENDQGKNSEKTGQTLQSPITKTSV
jgi:hypothetical protein